MAEHTKGPWELDDALRGESYTAINGEEWFELATVVTRMETDAEDNPEGLVNARLICAAPDMFEALVWLADEVDDPEALSVIRGAIAKARGER